ncbi:MAG: 16S rRNA (cytosine(1402)-N(4))-methyltransferase RsmH [Thermodesulfobacteriota bacterium]
MEGEAASLHQSVLLEECLEYLAPKSGGTYVDGTLGLGGHSEAILKKTLPDGRLIAFDWDEAAIVKSRFRLAPFQGRFEIVHRNFGEIADGLDELGVTVIDGLLIDIGLSSLQLDIGGRGFTFRKDEPLDMRMDTRRKETAASILANCREEELADIFYYYGEEKQARPIARAVVEQRDKKPILRSIELADLVARTIPGRFHPKRIHVATKVFQALRIAVNSELENLAKILDEGVRFLRPGARFCVISFHSLEDRMVKRKFKENPLLRVVTKKPVVAKDKELKLNKRARSAKLRVAERIAA